MKHAMPLAALLALPIVASAQQAPAAAASAPQIRFSAPVNGWRYSAGKTDRYTQEVHYPAAAVNTPEGQDASALIAGDIRGRPKADNGRAPPATLIVNGVAMPQRVDADGHFSRPYAFGAGSNSVELRDGGADRRVQFYENYPGRAQPRLRVVLAWDTDGTDLDLHVVAPDGQHAWYGDRVVPDGGALDVDVTTGYGPEIYSNATPPPGTYLVYVNYYGSGDNNQILTVATITVITDENTPDEKRQSFVVPMRKAGELTEVASFALP
jgi:uncharacterized protein YfaP (DUF2135 family)